MTTPQEITKCLCCPECGKTGDLRLTTVDKTGFEKYRVPCFHGDALAVTKEKRGREDFALEN